MFKYLATILISFISVVVIYNYVPLNFFETKKPLSIGTSSCTTIAGSDTISSSRSVINTCLANLNTDKIASGDTAASLTITTLTNSTLTGSAITANNSTSTVFSSNLAQIILSYLASSSIGFLTSGSLVASTTNATSTFAGGFGIGSTTPYTSFGIESAGATTTIAIGSKTKPTCIQFFASGGSPFRAYATTSGYLLLQAGNCQ